MGRTAHCPARKRSLFSQALGDANRGVFRRLAGSNRESPPHRPPERRAFPRLGSDFPGRAGRGSVQSQAPVRTPDEFPTVRALGRAAAAVLFLPAVLRRGAGQGRRADTTREFESVSRVADELARIADVEGVARTLLDEFTELFDVGFVALTFVSDDAREASGYLAFSGGNDVDWWPEVHLDLEHEPSGVGSAVLEATGLTAYDTQSSGVVSRRLAEAVGAKSAAFIPLFAEERVSAVISVATLDEPRVFSTEDLAVMQTLASEAAVALERLRSGVALQEALKRNEEQLAQQTALLRAAHVLSSELDLPVVLQRLADQLAQLLDADAGDCSLLDSDRGLFRCVAVHGFDRSLLSFEFPMGQGLAGAAIREGRPLVESAYGEISTPVPHPAYEGFPDVITAPMFWSDEVRGVLGVGRRAGRPFTPRDADILEAFAGLAALALRNAEMFTQSARQARIQQGFYRIASVLGQSLSRPATLEAIAQAAAEALGGSSAAVLVRSSGRLEAAGAYELPADLGKILTERAWGEQSPLFRAATEGRILVSSSISDDERLLPDLRAAAATNRYLSLISVPVDAPRDAGRGLVLIFFVEERSFSDDDLELARHLADATRGALERSELFEAERGARALAQQLTRTGRMLTSELDPAAVLDEVVQQAPALVNAEAAAFRLLDGDELVVTAADGDGAQAALGSRGPGGGGGFGAGL